METDRLIIGGLLLLVAAPSAIAYFLFELRLARRASAYRTARHDNSFPFWTAEGSPTVTGATAGADVHRGAVAAAAAPGRSAARLVEDLEDEGDTLSLKMVATAYEATERALRRTS
jgi:hypothetical protein